MIRNRWLLLSCVLLGVFGPGSGLVPRAWWHRKSARSVSVELGRVWLVGAGPGDPELLTLAALRVICNPSALVVADRLVSADILQLVAGELRVAGKRPGCAEVAQEEIYDWVREGVLQNRTVVRLKIGDPFVFGRGGEEVLELRRSLGVEPVVVPGVSAALAAPLAAGVPVTHRGVSHQVVITTGYGRNGSQPELPAYHPWQTVVFLMSVGRIGQVAASLVENHGFPADCPALAVEKASCPEQRVVLGDISDIASLVDKYQIKAPSTVVFGHSVRVLYHDSQHGLVQDGRRFFDIADDVSQALGTNLLERKSAANLGNVLPTVLP